MTTQNKSTVPMAENTRQASGSAQWFLEPAHPKYKKNALQVLICGEDAFKQIAEDIKHAQASIDIICWGFDPAMELTRSGSVWPRGDTWGLLLADAAEGKLNGGKPVQVRLLSWYGFIGNQGTNNMPGYGADSDYELRQAASRGMAAALMPGGKLPPMPEPTSPRDRRETFNAQWYRKAVSGQIKNLTIRTRDGDSAAVVSSLKGEPGKRGFIEQTGMAHLATHHQKTILIDYEHEGGRHAVGYVMGLNSVTDYWDTQQHAFHDPRRGAPWEGHGDDDDSCLMPYQDYACRVRGDALVAVSQNFTSAWNRAKGGGTALARSHDLKAAPAGLTAALGQARSQAQIVRTQPEEGEKSIQLLYRQASSFARRYLYAENQYFQNTQWAQQLKAEREAFVRGWRACSKTPDDMPNLHVMVVIPTPERAQMVPRTYDTVKVLGHADSMPKQDKKVEDELKAHAQWEAHAQEARAKGQAPNPYAYPGAMSDVAKDAKATGDKANVSNELNMLGMRTLVGSLWTFNHQWRTTQRKEIDTAREWEGVPSAKQRHTAMLDRINKARYREIYIHSKLLLIDDSMFTLGSANLNQRSMAVDSEINIASDDPQVCTDLRKRVWGLHTGNAEGCNPSSLEPKVIAKAFDRWEDLMKNNADRKPKGLPPTGFLFPFNDDRTSSIRLG